VLALQAPCIFGSELDAPQTDGLVVGLVNPTVIAIDVPGYSDDDCLDCAEYVGITGDIDTP